MYSNILSRAPLAAVILLSLSAPVVSSTGCSSDALVSDLGYVEVSWTIKGQTATDPICTAAGATHVRIRYGDTTPDTHACDKTGPARRSAGDGARIDLVVELLSKSEAVLDKKTGTVKITKENTSTLVVDFLGATPPDGGTDGPLDMGPGAEGGMEAGPPDMAQTDMAQTDMTQTDMAQTDMATPDSAAQDSTSME